MKKKRSKPSPGISSNRNSDDRKPDSMTSDVQSFDNRLDLVPHSPGVYLMKDASGSVIYVGKANDLRQRLRSYFTASPKGNARILALIHTIADFSVIICDNERESLVLESTLIKKHQPRYNILLRDDKDYPYVRVTLNEQYPRILKAFRIGDDQNFGARYFGPYLSRDVKLALEAIRSIFPVKTCRRVLPRDIGKERPCLQYYIGRCIGPCKGDVPVEDYRAVMEQICRFFAGRTDDLLHELRQEMASAANQLHYERAARIRDRIQALENLMEKQKVVDAKPIDQDVLAIAGNGSEICLQKLEIRHGRLVGASATFWPEKDLDEEEIIRSFLIQHYQQIAWIPPEILIPVDLSDQAGIETYLSSVGGKRCRLRKPQRGKGVDRMNMARENANEALRRHTLQGGLRQSAIEETLIMLGSLLKLDKTPQRIEAIDISQTGSDDQAAGLVVFENGRPLRRHYRHFRLNQNQAADDYEAMRLTLARRLGHLDDASFGLTPDLILADGGIGHVRAIQSVLHEHNLSIPVAGIVKDEKHRTRGLVTPDGSIIELRHQPAGQTRSLRVSERDADHDRYLDDAEQLALLRLLTAIQDEAHRFANRYRMNLNRKRQTRFSLENIPGVGPARRRLLLQAFQSIKKISEAGIDDLLAVKGLGNQAAHAVYDHFHPAEQED